MIDRIYLCLSQDVGFVLIFSDQHLWASIFSVILVNYIFMDGKCDYFQGKLKLVSLKDFWAEIVDSWLCIIYSGMQKFGKPC